MDINIINFYRRKDGFNEVFKRMKKHENERKQVLIVPEKFGVSAEKALFEYIGGASFFIDVTTFDRMADKYVVDKNIQYLSKSAGVMLVQKIAQDNMDNLQVLSHSCTYNGFCENVFNTIMLLKSSQVSPDKLKQAVENLQDISRMKLEDIQKLYNIYEETLSNRFIDSANKMDKLGQELAYDDDIREIDFYVYSPKLTKQVLNVLSTLAKNAHSLTFMLDAYNENSSVYDANYLQITSLIKSLGAKYNESTVQRFDSLSVMLKAVGSNQRNSNNNIKFYSFKTQQEEITALCQDIVRQGDRYYDSAVLVCNLEKYQSTLEKIFSSFNIAYFMDTKQTLLDLTPTRTLLQLINLLYEFKVDKVLNIVKSKIFEYDDDKIQNFELYLKRWGINERNFFSENKPEDDLLLDFMSIYEDFVSKFKEFKNKMSVCNTYGEIIEVLREYIDKWHIAEYIQSECKRLNEIGQNQKSKLYEQIVKKWNTLFDQLENILGLNTVSVKDFYIVLKAGLNTVMVKTPPLNIDCVYIGEAGNAMLYDYKNIYVIGAVEGAFPVYNQDCGLIVDKELDQMREIAPIDPTIREVNVENICNNINNIVCTDNLWLSYPVSLFFVEQRPSTFLNLLRKAFVDKSGQPIDFSGFIAYDIMDEPEQFAESIVTQSRAITYVLSMKEQIYKPKSVQARQK